ncbi:MAG: hypothetical protein EPN41_15460 [Candidimonas sp.]|nr:MAG: hypothetical protein EPN41_15460 [Candidimonas sp.]
MIQIENAPPWVILVAELGKPAIWAILIGFIAYRYYSPISDWITSLKHVEGPGFSLHAERQELQEKAVEAGTGASLSTGPQAAAGGSSPSAEGAANSTVSAAQAPSGTEPSPGSDPVKFWQFRWAAERIYNVIFGTQMDLLIHLERSAKPLEETQIRGYFRESSRRGYRSSFINYVAFLRDNGLIAAEDVGGKLVYSITNSGRAFLNYVRQERLPQNRPL